MDVSAVDVTTRTIRRISRTRRTRVWRGGCSCLPMPFFLENRREFSLYRAMRRRRARSPQPRAYVFRTACTAVETRFQTCSALVPLLPSTPIRSPPRTIRPAETAISTRLFRVRRGSLSRQTPKRLGPTTELF